MALAPSDAATPGDDTPARRLDPRTDRARLAALDAAHALLVAGGVDAVTHARVAERARVSRTTLYKLWPDRSSLLGSTLEHLTTVDRPPPTGDLRTDLLALARQFAARLADDERAIVMLSVIQRSLHDEAVQRAKQQLRRGFHETAHEILGKGVRDGRLPADLDTELALGGIFGTLLFRRLLTDEPIDDDLVVLLVDRFLTEAARPSR